MKSRYLRGLLLILLLVLMPSSISLRDFVELVVGHASTGTQIAFNRYDRAM